MTVKYIHQYTKNMNVQTEGQYDFEIVSENNKRSLLYVSLQLLMQNRKR